MDSVSSEDCSDNTQRSHSDNNNNNDDDNVQRVYFVPYRWWNEAQGSMPADSDGKKGGVLYTGLPGSSYAGPMKIINNIFNSDLVFGLRREEDSAAAVAEGREDGGEAGVSGRDFALVSGEMWLQALKWHGDSKNAIKDEKGFSSTEDDMADVYPIQLRLSVQKETSSLGVRISRKDNPVELFKRSCKIFCVDTEMLRIWDFSGRTTLFFVNDKNKIPSEGQRQSEEIFLELQVYGLSDSSRCREGKKDEITSFSGSASLKMNGGAGSTNSYSAHANSLTSSRPGNTGSLGLTGLQNLGNTCFMNSALQCLAHTPKLVDYFLEDYGREINDDNPLGMDGEIALAFGDLLRRLWAPGASPVAPRTFKSKLARFAPQFSGFNQHDSQELLAFLLDGLHEDLNRVKRKPYIEAKDADDRPDEEVANEYWHNHLARNDSIIVDVCQGQYKSTLVCPICRKVSVTFDPFMYLSLPLPSTTMRPITLTVVSSGINGIIQLSSYTISVPKNGRLQDLTRALSIACSLGADETLLVAEAYNNLIIRFLEDPSDSLSLIRDADRLVAYRFIKYNGEGPFVVFMNQQMEKQYVHGKATNWKALGIPIVSKLYNITNGFDLRSLYLKLLSSFQIPPDEALENLDLAKKAEINAEMEGARTPPITDGLDSPSAGGLEFYITDEKGMVKDSKILMNEPLAINGELRLLHVLVYWSDKQIQQYDNRLFSPLPEVFKSGILAKRPQESASLYKCLEAFLQEEPLGPEDMWYCPTCKKHRQASKKLDLWRLPEILVIHLKRFQYSRFMKNKLETYVDFPVDNLDLSAYIAHGNDKSYRYMLYAISNHYGSMGGGHYTAFVHHGGDQWYDFDDSKVHPISKEKIKSSAAYVLFYRRVFEE